MKREHSRTWILHNWLVADCHLVIWKFFILYFPTRTASPKSPRSNCCFKTQPDHMNESCVLPGYFALYERIRWSASQMTCIEFRITHQMQNIVKQNIIFLYWYKFWRLQKVKLICSFNSSQKSNRPSKTYRDAYLNIEGVIPLPINENVLVSTWRMDSYVCAVNRTNNTRKPSHSRELGHYLLK